MPSAHPESPLQSGAEPLRVLAEASSTLLETRAVGSVLARILGAAQQLIAADAYAIWRAFEPEKEWRIVAAHGLRSARVGYVLIPPPQVAGGEPGPGTALRAIEQPIASEDVFQQPELSHRDNFYRQEGVRSLLAVPLKIGGRPSGTIVFYYRERRVLRPEEVQHATALGNLAAAAIYTSELHEAQRRERQRLTFLAESSELLASSLDYETTLRRVAQLAVPGIADWCSVGMIDGGRLTRLTVAHADPEKIKIAEDYARRYPEILRDDSGTGLMVKTRQSQLYPIIGDRMLQQAAIDDEHLAVLRALGMSSAIAVPLIVRDRVVGVLRLISADSGRIFNQEDLQLAEDLARRAAVAIDNARLHLALSASETRFRSLIEQSPISTVVYDEASHPIDANPAFAQLWGFEPGELPPGYTVFGDERLEAAGILPALYAGFQGESAQLQPVHVPLEPGSSHPQKRGFWMRPTIYPVRDSGGAVTRVVLLQEDVSERIEAQQARRDSEERLRLSYSVARIGSWSWDLAGTRIFWSQEFKAIHGLPPETEPSHERGLALVHPEDRDYVITELRGYLESSTDEFSIEHRAVGPDGILRWIFSRSRIQRDAHGKALAMLGVSIDVTDRREAEEALRRSEQRYRSLVAATAAITWTTDPEGRFVEPQPGWSEFTGHTWEQIRDYGWLGALHPEDRSRIEAAWRAALQVTPAIYEVTGRLWNDARQGYRHFIVRAVPMLAPDGSVREWVGTTTDIHDQKQAEEALRRTEKLAAAGRLAATVAHEINNPLESVTNLIYLAELDARLPGNVREHLALAQEELERVAQIVRQTLGFYRETAVPQETDLDDVAREVVKLYHRRAASKGVTLTAADGDPAASATVVSGEIKQVIANLIANAIDATGAGGAVEVSVQQTSGAVTISVRDNGTGITPQDRARLFEPFFSTKKDVGTGLGLWVSKGIVEKYGGRISVVSSTDADAHGTTFAVTLPVAATEVEPEPAGSSAHSAFPAGA